MTIPKFRAWHKELKKMFGVKSLVFTIGTATIASRDDIVPSRNVSFDELVIMQSTGQCDSYDNDIYDGDIIALDSYNYIEYGRVFYSTTKARFRVEFTDEVIDLNEVVYSYVAGNVWENPELLEVKE